MVIFDPLYSDSIKSATEQVLKNEVGDALERNNKLLRNNYWVKMASACGEIVGIISMAHGVSEGQGLVGIAAGGFGAGIYYIGRESYLNARERRTALLESRKKLSGLESGWVNCVLKWLVIKKRDWEFW